MRPCSLLATKASEETNAVMFKVESGGIRLPAKCWCLCPKNTASRHSRIS